MTSIFVHTFISTAAVEVRNTTISEVDDATMVSMLVYVDFSNISLSINDLQVWESYLETAVNESAMTEAALSTIRTDTIFFNDCDECKGVDKESRCSNYSECLNVPGDYTCHCFSGFREVEGTSGKTVECELILGLDFVTTPMSPTFQSSRYTTECTRAKMDLFILVESSKSIGLNNFELIKDAINTMIMELEIGPNEVQIGLARYSRTVDIIFDFNTYTSKADVLAAVSRISYTGLGTMTGHALQYVVDNAFTPARGRRLDLELHLIVITDGRSADNVTDASLAMQRVVEGIKVVGVTKNVDYEQLNTIAGSFGEVFTIQSFDELTSDLPPLLSESLCPAKLCNSTDNYVDVVFLLDSTTAVSNTVFADFVNVIKNYVLNSTISEMSHQVAVARFDRIAWEVISLSEGSQKEYLLSQLNSLAHSTTTSDRKIGKAFQYVTMNMLAPSKGQRLSAGLHVVVFTAGASSDEFIRSARDLEDKRATIHSIALGDIAFNDLSGLYTVGMGLNYRVPSANEMSNHVGNISQQIIQAIERKFVCSVIYPPIGITVLTHRETVAHVRWTPVADVASYGIQYYSEDNPQNVHLFNYRFPQIELNQLMPGTRYYLRVQSIRGLIGNYSEPVEFWTTPARVEAVDVRGGLNHLNVSFNRARGGSSSYILILYDETTSTEIARETLNTTADQSVYTVTFNASELKRYSLIILTQSGPKTSVEARFPIQFYIPPPPTGLGVRSVNETSISIFWNESPYAAGYIVKVTGWFEGSEKTLTFVTNDTNLFTSGLTPGYLYDFRVAAYNHSIALSSEYSRHVVTHTRPPSIPLINTLVIQGHRPQLEVSIVPAVNGLVDYYILTIAEKSNPEDILHRAEVNATKLAPQRFSNNLIASHIYIIYGYSVSGDMQSRPTTTEVIYSGISPPTNVQLFNITMKSVRILWDPSVGASSYEINLIDMKDSNQSSSPRNIKINGTSYQITGLQPGTWYVFSISAKAGDLAESISKNLIGNTLPSIPLHINVVSEDPATAVITFTAAEGNVDEYRMNLTRADQTDHRLAEKSIQQYNNSVSGFRVTMFPLKASYKYTINLWSTTAENRSTVVSRNFTQRKLWFKTDSILLLPKITKLFNILLADANPPRIVRVDQVTYNYINVSWEVVHEAEFYRVSIKKLPSEQLQYIETDLQHAQFINLVPGTNYTLYFYSVSNNVTSANHTKLTAVTDGFPPPQNIRLFNMTSNSVTVSVMPSWSYEFIYYR
ncbi:collagen alpha-1(XII) chain-like isoform X1 [Ciona intestinalis]